MENLMFGGIFTKAIKEISFLLDEMVYSLARLMFRIFCYISEATIVNDAMIEKVTRRIYVILGIGMTFIIAYYLLNYIVDPDKINDKASGAGTIIKDIIIALVIMTMTPTLFTKLYAFQHTVITSGVISKIFLGGSENYDASSTNPGLTAVQQGANEITVNVFSAFVMPKDEGWSSLDCVNVTNEDPQAMINYCNAYDKSLEDGKIAPFQKIIMDETHFRYWPLLSTVAGIGLAFFMLSFCINLAKRVGKMAVLQVLAPIPALLEIVPGTKGTRKTWIDMLVKTYLEVFVFQLVIFVIMFLITLVPDAVRALFENFDGVGILVRVFTLVLLIFGLLQFAKEAPKMVMDLLGIKGTGVISAALKRGVNMAGVTGNAFASAFGNTVRGVTENKGLGRVGGALFGGTSAFARNIWAGRNVKSLSDANKNRKQINQGITTRRINRQAYNFEQGGFVGGLKGHAGEFVGGINRQFKNATDIGIGYQGKKEQERVFKGLKDKEKAITNIINMDAQMSALRSAYQTAGDASQKAFIKTQMDARMSEIIKNKNQFRTLIGEYNGYVGSHQTTARMLNDSVDFSDFELNTSSYFDFDAKSGEFKSAGDLKRITTGERDIHGDGVLDSLGKDSKYQEQKAQETINEHVHQEAQQAAREKTEDKK